MMKSIYFKLFFGSLAAVLCIALSCASSTPETKSTPTYPEPSEAFKSYWYSGLGEVNTFELKQARYGELRSGEAVQIYVTEPFDTDKQVKSDQEDGNDVRVMKINFVKKFLTGIYPYSVMTSAFTPVDAETFQQPMKATSSAQEWCGHAFIQMNQKASGYRAQQFSYFESEGDKDFEMKAEILEDGLWTSLRMNPEALPVGKFKVVPSLTYIRFLHIEFKAYNAELRLAHNENEIVYTVDYPELKRVLRIYADNAFPHTIRRWEETYVDGWGAAAQELTTEATLIHTELLPYWQLNHNSDSTYRTQIGLSK
jgi:hypothetical protein